MLCVAGALSGSTGCGLPAPTSPPLPAPTDDPAPFFTLDGRPFCFAGTNNYYLSYKSDEMVLDVLETARELNLGVIRTWAFIDRGSLDGTTKNVHGPGHADGIYFQSWNASEQRPAYNDGPDGLERLDFVLHHARRLGLRVVLVLTNNWRDFGGMDQYLTWYGLEHHDQFYSDDRVRAAYRDWTLHLVTRTNAIDGTPYVDDPAIFAWELANEPRTQNGGPLDRSSGFADDIITEWAREMSDYIRSVDPNHLVSVGDEGFFREGPPDHLTSATTGVDHRALLALPAVDFGTFHAYPTHWNTDLDEAADWVAAHVDAARTAGKPTILEEYGMPVSRRGGDVGPVVGGLEERERFFTLMNEHVLRRGGNGTLAWMLGGRDPNEAGGYYRDYDHFTFHRGDDTFAQLGSFAVRFPTEARACELARTAISRGEVTIPRSPFVGTHRAPPIRAD